MEYYEFSTRFGGACRTKHVQSGYSWLKRTYKNLFSPARKNTPERRWARNAMLRPARVPRGSELPKGFIRLDPWEAEYLFAMSARAQLGIVEIGRRYGGSAFLMSCANDRVPIYSIDISPADDARLKRMFVAAGVGENVQLITGDSQRSKHPQIKGFDLLFVDGDHSREGCSLDLENFYGELAPGGHIVLHDCYFGCPVQDAVHDFMRKHPELRAWISPFNTPAHWNEPHGSLMHLQKPAT